ncbi:MAG TPA: hypothetical protein EYG46_02015 [Myxococcales bacterium]|nr:hypothetical protein [Myxococcales bacterium]
MGRTATARPANASRFPSWPRLIICPAVGGLYSHFGHSDGRDLPRHGSFAVVVFFWGGEHGVNEHGLVIGNQAVFSNEIVERRAGLIVMDLLRLALEHTRNRNEAIVCIASRLDAHGQGGASFGPDVAQDHNSFNIADPHGAGFMKTLDRHWVVREVERDSLSNHIGTGTDWDKCSSGLESFSRSEGY